MRIIRDIIVHCSATEAGKNFRARDIESWHRARGFKRIGYHYIIDLDGTIERGRPISLAGAHCKGHNAHSIGICYIGGLKDGKPADTRTWEQRAALNKLIYNLIEMYHVRVHGHRDYSTKECPCFDATKEYQAFFEQICQPGKKINA